MAIIYMKNMSKVVKFDVEIIKLLLKISYSGARNFVMMTDFSERFNGHEKVN